VAEIILMFNSNKIFVKFFKYLVFFIKTKNQAQVKNSKFLIKVFSQNFFKKMKLLLSNLPDGMDWLMTKFNIISNIPFLNIFGLIR
jgi:hypothetical protein